MTLLALDTSTSFAALALVRDQTPLAELNWHVGTRHSTELLPRLQGLLQQAGIMPEELSVIAVALGPGSFNGIRVALATAKSLAFSLRIPLVGVPTLDCSAWGSRAAGHAGQTIWAIQEAGRGQLYTARYAPGVLDPVVWRPVESYHLLTPAELAARVEATALFCGEWRAETRAALTEALGERAWFASPLGIRRGLWLAELALARAAREQYDEPTRIEPLYLRRPAITTSAKVKQQDLARQEDGVPGGEGG
jgi:tRNA threonylcarbamoyladenosine biosynthesis protein TsaB